jgi:hypothetical protein
MIEAYKIFVRFQVPTAASMKMAVFYLARKLEE